MRELNTAEINEVSGGCSFGGGWVAPAWGGCGGGASWSWGGCGSWAPAWGGGSCGGWGQAPSWHTGGSCGGNTTPVAPTPGTGGSCQNESFQQILNGIIHGSNYTGVPACNTTTSNCTTTA